MTPKQELPLANHLRNKARKLRKLDATLTQTSALDHVARQHGYSNWRHFTNSLPALVAQHFVVTLKMVWRDSRTSQYFSESIDIRIPKSLNELFPKVADVRNLIGECSVDYEANTIALPAYFARLSEAPQNHARWSVTKKARRIAFVAATGLIYSSAWSKPMSDFKKVLGSRNPSCFDHTNVWRTTDGKYVITTEPYYPRLQQDFAKLQEECERAGYQVEVPDWIGMHNPDLQHPSSSTRLVLISHKSKGTDLKVLIQQLNQLPNDLLTSAWTGYTTEL